MLLRTSRMVSTMSGPSSCVLMHAACSAVYPRLSVACRIVRFCHGAATRARRAARCSAGVKGGRGGGGVRRSVCGAEAVGVCAWAIDPHQEGFDGHRVVSPAHLHEVSQSDLLAEIPPPFGQCRVRVWHGLTEGCTRQLPILSYRVCYKIECRPHLM